MTYFDGSLTVRSLALRHDRSSELLGQPIYVVATGLGVDVMAIGSTTLHHRAGEGARKEPDLTFYIGPAESRMRLRAELDLAVDPPPSLAVEIENTRGAADSSPIYARPGIPEVWLQSIPQRTVWIGRLDAATYRAVDRSVAFPRLTIPAIAKALERFAAVDLADNEWFEQLKVWTRALPEPPPAG